MSKYTLATKLTTFLNMSLEQPKHLSDGILIEPLKTLLAELVEMEDDCSREDARHVKDLVAISNPKQWSKRQGIDQAIAVLRARVAFNDMYRTLLNNSGYCGANI